MKVSIGTQVVDIYRGSQVPTFARFYLNETVTVYEDNGDPVRLMKGSYQEFSASISGVNVTVGASSLYSTTDSSSPAVTGYLDICDASGNLIPQISPAYTAISISTSTPTTWEALNLASQGPIITPPPNWIDEVTTIVNSLIEGRFNPVLSVDYGNSLPAAISSIGSTPTVLVVNENTTLSSSVTVPSTLTLLFQDGAKVVKSASGAIVFQGLGVDDPESEIPCFSGFAAGNITFTGSVYPSRLSANLWDNATVSTRLNNALNAVSGKTATVVAYPGSLGEKVTVLSGLSLELSPGDYTNAITGANNYTLILQDNTNLYGTPAAVLHENADSVRLIYGSGSEHSPFDAQNTNIHVWGFTIKGNPATSTDSAASAIFLGNLITGGVRNMTFDDTHGFHAYAGSFAGAGAYTDGIEMVDNLVIKPRTQSIGVINGRNFIVARNTFREIQPDPSGPFAAIIDVEPNSDGEIVDNGLVIDNVFDGSTAQQGWDAIVVQPGGSEKSVRNVRIAGNVIVGTRDSDSVRKLAAGITLTCGVGCSVEDNLISGASLQGITVSASRHSYIRNNNLTLIGGGGSQAMTVLGVSDSDIDGNIIDNSASSGSVDSRIVETEVTATVSTSSTAVTRASGQLFGRWMVGGTFHINGTAYVVASVTDVSHLTLTGSAGTQSNVTLTSVSNNRYSLNRSADGIYLSTTGTSQILSTADDQFISAVADAAYAATRNSGVIVYTSLTSARTVSLPTAVGLTGKVMCIKDGAGTAGTHNITVDPDGSETIDGASTFVINSNYGEVWIKCNGANWLTIADSSSSSTGGIEVINIQSSPYNAKGDGTTDDTAAIQAAIDVAATTGGQKIVYCPAPSAFYKCTGQLDFSLTDAVTLLADGARVSPPDDRIATALVYTGTASEFIKAGKSVGLTFNGIAIQTNNASFTGDLVTLDSNGTPRVTYSTAFINCAFGGRVEAARHARSGINATGAVELFVHTNVFAWLDYGVIGSSSTRTQTYSNAVTITENRFEYYNVFGISCYGGLQWSILNNVFEFQYGTSAGFGITDELPGLPGARSSAGVNITGNGFYDADAGTWISIFPVAANIVANRFQVDNGGTAILFTGGDSATLSSNYVNGSAGGKFIDFAVSGIRALADNGSNVTEAGVTYNNSPGSTHYPNGNFAAVTLTSLAFATGGAVTQLTSRTTSVSINKTTGAITLFSAAGSPTAFSFTVTNSTIVATDTIILSQQSGADAYALHVTNVAAGSFQITVVDLTGVTVEAPVINFVVVQGANS